VHGARQSHPENVLSDIRADTQGYKLQGAVQGAEVELNLAVSREKDYEKHGGASELCA
jgi:hypothetical protein